MTTLNSAAAGPRSSSGCDARGRSLSSEPSVVGSVRSWAASDAAARRASDRSAASVSLNVFADNDAALALYESLGFAPAVRPPDEPGSPSLYLELRSA